MRQRKEKRKTPRPRQKMKSQKQVKEKGTVYATTAKKKAKSGKTPVQRYKNQYEGRTPPLGLKTGTRKSGPREAKNVSRAAGENALRERAGHSAQCRRRLSGRWCSAVRGSKMTGNWQHPDGERGGGGKKGKGPIGSDAEEGGFMAGQKVTNENTCRRGGESQQQQRGQGPAHRCTANLRGKRLSTV